MVVIGPELVLDCPGNPIDPDAEEGLILPRFADFSRPVIHRSLLVLFSVGLILTGWRLVAEGRLCAAPRRGTGAFTDVRLFLHIAQVAHDSGRIYTPEEPNYFAPASGVYKYPPTYIALLQPLRDVGWRRAVPILFWINSSLLLLGLLFLLRTVRPSLLRGLLLLLVFLNWSPFWESFAGMQLELAMAMLVAAAAYFSHGGAGFRGGVALGFPGALKVYPVVLASYFLPFRGRRWPVVLGALAGAGLPLLAASLFIPPRNLVEYVRLLPKLGGVSLFADNIGLPGQTARLSVALIQGTASLDYGVFVGSENAHLAAVRSAAVRGLARGLSFAASAALILFVVLRVSASLRSAVPGTPERRIRETLGLALSLCVLLLVLPTSWPDYQTLLVVPLVLGLGWARDPREEPWPWVLLLAAGVAGAIQLPDKTLTAFPNWMPILRAWIPAAIGGAILLRMRDRGVAGAATAA